MIRVGLVGAGRRMVNMNLPVLKQFDDEIEIVGVTTKSGTVTEKANLNVPVYTSAVSYTHLTLPTTPYV